MTALYELITPGAVPVSLADMKAFMKISTSSDDVLITSMLQTATTWGENYTGREFRATTWALFLDAFEDRIHLSRAPVASITTVKHLVSAALVTVAASVYYLKKNLHYSEILLDVGQTWPTDTDEREQVIEIEFTTESYRDVDAIASAIKRHVSYWYANRGDCSDEGGGSIVKSNSAAFSAKKSGVTAIYDQFRIERV